MNQSNISKTQSSFIQKGIQSDIRQDGRSRLDYRQSFLGVNVLLQASGSARHSVYNGSDVLVGVKVSVESVHASESELETSPPLDESFVNADESTESQTAGKIIVNVEWSNSTLKSIGNRKIQEKSSELSEFITRVLNGPQGGIDLKKLCIVPGALIWVLYIDCMILVDGGNLLDTLFNGIRAALCDTKMPVISIEKSEHVFEYDISDESFTSIPGCNLMPASITFYKIGNRFIVDASVMEEACTEATLTLLCNSNGNICGLKKSALGGIEPSLLGAMLKQGKSIGQFVIQAQVQALSNDVSNDLSNVPS